MPLNSSSENPHDGTTQGTPQLVLVVDDEPVARISLTARLKRLGYRVIEADDSKIGLELLRRERPDLTILDWMMPGMDGPTFCEMVRQDPELGSSQILLMTGHDEPEQIAEGLARGADDFLSKAASKQEITARVQAGLRAARLVRTLEQARDEIRHKQVTLEQELQSAAQYVESLLPAPGALLTGIQMFYAYRPSLALGGDLFNVLRWGNHVVGFYLLDASGHGVSPALRSASLSTFLREDSLQHQVGANDPGAILTEANRQFPITENGDYFTIIFARLDLRSHMLSYATAGHNGAFLHHQSGEVSWLKNPGLPLGFSVSTAYATVNIAVSPGDRLYFFSDGLYELPAPTGELWGQARLEEAVREIGHRPLAEVINRTVEKATQWLGHERFPDDAAMIGLDISI